MDGRAARWAVATLADVREGWVCGAGWAFSARYEGLVIDVQGDVRDRHGLHRDAPGPASVEIGRLPGGGAWLTAVRLEAVPPGS